MTDEGSDRLASIAGRLSDTDMAAAAAGALGTAAPVRTERPRVIPLSAHHYDSRTVGMLHVTGAAVDASSRFADWSCVVKVIDLHAAPRANTFVDPANEIAVYRSGMFAADEPFRPARCYHISDGPEGTTLLWLEDLTGLQKPPFTLEELDAMAAHLGAWNAQCARSPPPVPFATVTNSFLLRWSRTPTTQHVARLRELESHRYVRQAFGNTPLETLDDFLHLVLTLNRKTAALAPSLCFGDCNVGNLFSGMDETVAVDWASLARDPPGVDAGCMIGSAISWGRDGAAVAHDERALFETYLKTLRSSGCHAAADDVRRAYYSHYAYYVCFCATMPALLLDEVFPIYLVERRFGARAEDIPALVAGVVSQLPGYIEELQQLTA